MKTFPFTKTLLAGTITALLCTSPAFAALPTTQNKDTTATPSEDTQKKDWSDRFSDDLRDIQDRMENLFSRAWRETENGFHNVTTMNGFSSSVNLSEDKDHYIVRVILPERDIQNVDVRVDSSNTLHILAREEQRTEQPDVKGSANNGALKEFSMSRYEQTIGLPGSVDSSKMTVDRKGSTLTVTLPKT